ncbi:MAG: phosphatidylinositol mannoside acyltransferase [Actinomycetota bacterium]
MEASRLSGDSLRVRLIGLGYLAAWRITRMLPEQTASKLFDALYLRSWRRNEYRRRIVAENLRPIVGDGPALDSVVKEAFRSYGRYWLEAFRLNDMKLEEVIRRTEFTGAEYIDEGVKAGGVILAVPHMGNWDACGWYVANRWGLAAVAEVLRPRMLFEKFVKYREALGIAIIPLRRGGDATGKCIDAIRSGVPVALVCDRDLSGSGVEVKLFGRTTKFPAGPAVVALRAGAHLLPACTLQRDNGWSVHVKPPVALGNEQETPEVIASIMQKLANEFEVWIQEHPEQWHAWSKYWID